MPNVKVRDHEAFDTALRRFKRICEKAGIISEMRRHEFFEKPKWKRKRLAAQARKRLLKKLSRERAMPARASAAKKKETRDSRGRDRDSRGRDS